MTRPFVALLGAGAVLGALLILLLASGSASPTHAVNPDIATIGIDTNISGNVATPCNVDPNVGYPCNNSTVLGAIDSCAAITSAAGANHTVQIDIVGKSIPAGGTNNSDGSNQSNTGAGQTDMALDWTPAGLGTSPIAVTAKDFTVALIHQGPDDNGTQQGVTGVGLNAAGESGHWKWDDIDVNTDLVGEGGPGIAVRLTITGVMAGTATLSLGPSLLTQADWTDIYNNEYSVGQVLGATIVVDGPCVAGTATPTPPASPTASPTPSPSPTPCTGDGCGPTNTPTATPVPTNSPVTTPVPTNSPTTTPVPTQTPTGTPIQTPVPTSPSHTNTPAPTPTPTLTATPRASGSTTGTATSSGSPKPAALPKTGGASGGGGDSLTIAFALALGAVLIAAAGGSVFVARAKREE